MEAVCGEVGAQGGVYSDQACGIAHGGVVCGCVESVEVDEPRGGGGEEDVGGEAEDVLGAQGPCVGGQHAWRVEDVEVDGGDDGDDEVEEDVGRVGEQVEEVVLEGCGEEVEGVEDGPGEEEEGEEEEA